MSVGLDVFFHGRWTRRRKLLLAAGLVVASAATVVVSHDLYQAASFSKLELLCQRADGSLWRDPSQGCGRGDDPRCAGETPCDDSTPLSEGWRHACTWLLFDNEAAPRGDEPFHDGASPGGGCRGRA